MPELREISKTQPEIYLQALKDKDLDAIIEKKTYIPFLGKDYTKQQLQNWLNKRIGILEDLLKKPSGEVSNKKQQVYDSLTIKQKLLATKISNGEVVNYENEKDWEDLIEYKLTSFVEGGK